MVKERGCTWDTFDLPYEQFIRYCNIRKYIKEIITISEEGIYRYVKLSKNDITQVISYKNNLLAARENI
jgi:hypothetical protein